MFVGIAYALISIAKAKEREWVSWIVPLILLSSVAQNLRLDAVPIVVLGIVAFLSRNYWLKWKWIKIISLRNWDLATAVLVLTIVIGLVVANPRFGRDPRARATAALGARANAIVVSTPPESRVWKCYLPEATIEPFSGDCNNIKETVSKSQKVVLDGHASGCDLQGFDELLSAGKKDRRVRVMVRTESKNNN